MTARNLTHDFNGLSELLLGQAQPAQFQLANQTGYWWGSKVSDDGNWTALSYVTDNANAKLPRSYNYGPHMLYNWISITAEETISLDDTDATDSICPRGWRIPNKDLESNHSWLNLLNGEYGIDSGSYTGPYAESTYQTPLNFIMTGAYKSGTGEVTGSHSFWSSNRYTGSYATFFGFNHSVLNSINYSGINSGFAVRCVKK